MVALVWSGVEKWWWLAQNLKASHTLPRRQEGKRGVYVRFRSLINCYTAWVDERWVRMDGEFGWMETERTK